MMLMICVWLTGCHHSQIQPSQSTFQSWSQAMQMKMQAYGEQSQKELQPYFTKAKVPYPPKQMALLIFKDSKTLELWSRSDPQLPWQFIHRFPVMAASGGPGPKLTEGDHQVPEGIYRIITLNPMSRFDLSMQLNYPNDFDKQQASLSGRTHLGNDIFIHGKNLSIGCIALGNQGIEELFPLVYRVGVENTTVIIAPNDLRKAPPLMVSQDPVWVPALYQQLNVALSQFALPVTPAKHTFSWPNLFAAVTSKQPTHEKVSSASSTKSLIETQNIIPIPKASNHLYVKATTPKNLVVKQPLLQQTHLAEEQGWGVSANNNLLNVTTNPTQSAQK